MRGLAIVGCIAGLVALVFGVPLALTLIGISVDAGVVVNALAAVVALGAAVVAYQAVGRQIAANAENVTRQIQAQTEAVSRQIESDRFERRRAERYAELSEALSVVAKLDWLSLEWTYFNEANPDKAGRGRAEQGFDRIAIDPITRRLRLLGLQDEAAAVQKVWTYAFQAILPITENERIPRSDVKQATDEAESLLYAAMDRPI